MSSQLPAAAIIHSLAGRTRLRIEMRRGDDAFFASIATGLSAIQGVGQIDVRPLTGSILVQHNPPFAQIAEAAVRARLFTLDIGAAAGNDRVPSPDAKMMVALGLGAFALWQLAKGRILPPAVTLALYAANLGGLLQSGNDTSAE